MGGIAERGYRRRRRECKQESRPSETRTFLLSSGPKASLWYDEKNRQIPKLRVRREDQLLDEICLQYKSDCALRGRCDGCRISDISKVVVRGTAIAEPLSCICMSESAY